MSSLQPIPLPRSRALLARYIDHTLLKPDATAAMIDRLCDECRAFNFFAACVNPIWVERCVARLAGSTTVVATVAGFPLGASLPQTKAAEARAAVESGAAEVDMVVNLGALLAGDEETVTHDIAAVVAAVKHANPGAIVKVILESAALNERQVLAGCRCVVAAGADFVKTSTGFHPAGGAALEAVVIMKRYAAPLRVKASGGIRELATSLAMIQGGADRLGLSASVEVMQMLPE